MVEARGQVLRHRRLNRRFGVRAKEPKASPIVPHNNEPLQIELQNTWGKRLILVDWITNRLQALVSRRNNLGRCSENSDPHLPIVRAIRGSCTPHLPTVLISFRCVRILACTL